MLLGIKQFQDQPPGGASSGRLPHQSGGDSANSADLKVTWSAEERQTCISLFYFSLSSSSAFRLFSERLRGGSGFCWTFYCDFLLGLFGLFYFSPTHCLGSPYAGFNLSVYDLFFIFFSIKHTTVWILRKCPVIWHSHSYK